MRIQKAVVALALTAVAYSTIAATTAVAAPAPTKASTCGQAVRNTQNDLRQAGAPTNATTWQGVRNAAQDFLNSHPWSSPATDSIKIDVMDLNRLCAK
ncbi:hypothetical protein ABT263_01845 [Kitasatospora sp. NPDC001603]|uniref:hypothetical protein n=1 Tax=Kitasatospora sp. NPDC001603 TaxID=3154388 RepID=UPI00332E8F0A